eukprot:IDg23648t1
MGAFHTIAAYNKEFTKWLLQVPTMVVDEQIFHYGQGLKNRIRVEIERSEVSTLAEAMRIADRMDNLYNSNRGTFTYSSGQSSGPTPMEIGQIPQRPKFRRMRRPSKRQALMIFRGAVELSTD